MRFDASEMKTLSDCGRKWKLSSRNGLHLRPKGINPNLMLGTLYHECLHALYLGGDVDKIVSQALRDLADPVHQRVIENMIRGYASQVLPSDLARYSVKDIEHRVSIRLPELQHYDENGEIIEDESVEICGAIDMICIEKGTNVVYGFEHKTAAKFRPDIYIAMDEQPRVYFIELQSIVQKMNQEHYQSTGEPGPYTVGGIYINEVKKVQKQFEYMRRLCHYSEAQVNKFKQILVGTGNRIKSMVETGEQPPCQPNYMNCSMCDYAGICQTIGYVDIDAAQVLEEFCEEFEVRTEDHLDEKVERKIEG